MIQHTEQVLGNARLELTDARFDVTAVMTRPDNTAVGELHARFVNLERDLRALLRLISVLISAIQVERA